MRTRVEKGHLQRIRRYDRELKTRVGLHSRVRNGAQCAAKKLAVRRCEVSTAARSESALLNEPPRALRPRNIERAFARCHHEHRKNERQQAGKETNRNGHGDRGSEDWESGIASLV